MFQTLSDLPESEQNKLIAMSLKRDTKGLICSPFFLSLSKETIIESLLLKVAGYDKSYSAKRLSYAGINEEDIRIDRIAEFLLFIRANLVKEVNKFDLLLLELFPVISLEQMLFQKGGVRYGFYYFAYHIREVPLTSLISAIKELIIVPSLDSPIDLDFEDELENYCNNKGKKRAIKTCYFTGEEAFPVTSPTSPYRVSLYSNQTQLGSRSFGRFASRTIQKELLLRKLLLGNDLKQDSVWAYLSSPIEGKTVDSGNPLFLMHKYLPFIVKGATKLLISTSILPSSIKEDYLIEDYFPQWLYSWDCKPSGNADDAQKVFDVIQAFVILTREKKRLSHHGIASNGDIFYLINQFQLMGKAFEDIKSIPLIRRVFESF